VVTCDVVTYAEAAAAAAAAAEEREERSGTERNGSPESRDLSRQEPPRFSVPSGGGGGPRREREVEREREREGGRER